MLKANSYDALTYFKREEFTNPDGMDFKLLLMLDLARFRAGIPFVITSSYRAGDKGAHGKGMAVDIRCWDGNARALILRALIWTGFRRIGIYPRHIHADIQGGHPNYWLGHYNTEDQHEKATDGKTQQQEKLS